MARRAFLPTLALAAIVLGLADEWVFYDASLGLPAAVSDFGAGCLLIGCGAIAWERRGASRVGPLMSLAGIGWFLGNAASPLLYLHRGPLVHLQLSYPTGRLESRSARAVVFAAYLDAAIAPLARNDAVTLSLSGGIAAAAVFVFAHATGADRKARGPALAGALAYAAVLAFAAGERLAGWNADQAALSVSYDLVVAAVAVALVVDLLRGRWAEAVVTGLVVDLGAASDAGTLQASLARTLGDPLLVVGYHVAGTGGFVDDAGRVVRLPAPGSGRTVTPLVDHGEEVGVLVHDEALLADRRLLESAAAAARIAVANAVLQAEARTRTVELEASRRRIVKAAGEQRRRIRDELQVGAGRRLEHVASLLGGVRAALGSADAEAVAQLELELADAQRDLSKFAQGVLPIVLGERGLMAALVQLAARSAVPVEVTGEVGRFPDPIEAALFFVCSEALANVSKHAEATKASISVNADRQGVAVEIADDGRGGADATRGSGLAGLADRVEALGGHLHAESPPGGGTRMVVWLPLSGGPV